ncbi:M3 family oligoendopeptidase [Emticicia sp. BO119]|uniref:M3 family oligoendopeptidase n=1 Tax=Emticicia sp. BO119 TaxID=2757768 RepID=UPI0015F10156|nr:M3 family oligoendopeptidase [Emticicia sp. BO119]MBA4851551.1 M3 family oligoendopeptidase [Emticicia sp. BO119]
MEEIVVPQRKARKFIGEEFLLTSWEEVKPLYENLVNRTIADVQDLRQWFIDRSELESYLSENMAWRYIKMTCDTASEEKQKAYHFFVEQILPNSSAYDDQLNKKALESPYLSQLQDSGFDITVRGMKKAVDIFREENIPLATQVQTKQTEYQVTTGAMTVIMNGEEMTLQKAGDFLLSPDRAIREEAWTKISERRYQDHEKLDNLFNELRDIRHQMGVNAGFANYRDYMFAAMGRFDYTPQDCFNFHEAVAETVVPLVDKMAKERKEKLKVAELRPWDLKVDTDGKPALKPFAGGEDLLDKTVQCFTSIDVRLANYIRIMRTMGHFDVESRVGKAPGGYNYPLEEIGVPFIFMNATSNLRDVVTMVHEGGHAIHSFETRDLPINSFRNTPSEVAELASMSMELISMEHWDAYFTNEEDLKRAKVEHLEDILEVLPWIATIDKFQHWIYENPTHTIEERQEEWVKIFELFSDSVTNWKGFERFKKYVWQRQLHVFELPFYYIEYGMAQLGAISVWRNYKQDTQQGLAGYLNALKLGYTAPIGKIYEAANIKFDFSKEYIAELMAFVESELEKLK